ncbi:hypothetical protein IEQ34_014449 [Dendrobium chrysotoxum]|uniref:Uncharacterized protein n=1 Tax=Dendrobium chrysotoxum TaxID=161865 RepID=A0AAV7GM05_DENCH|nr:hypothetical protein IEQ34_014449 [Dendrobium chrysotoxum]
MASLPLLSPLFPINHHKTKRPRVNACAASNGRRPWWTPLFHSAFTGDQGGSEERETTGDSVEEVKDGGSPAAISFSVLTPEKARVLRRELRATETWHDAMYHSAIASRLASPDQA